MAKHSAEFLMLFINLLHRGPVSLPIYQCFNCCLCRLEWMCVAMVEVRLSVRLES